MSYKFANKRCFYTTNFIFHLDFFFNVTNHHLIFFGLIGSVIPPKGPVTAGPQGPAAVGDARLHARPLLGPAPCRRDGEGRRGGGGCRGKEEAARAAAEAGFFLRPATPPEGGGLDSAGPPF